MGKIAIIARTNAKPEDMLKDTFLLRDTIAYQPTSSLE
jgi:hypothetical protein